MPVKLLAVPKMYTGLVPDNNLDAQDLENTLSFDNDFVPCLPGQVRIKVKSVVTLHVRRRW